MNTIYTSELEIKYLTKVKYWAEIAQARAASARVRAEALGLEDPKKLTKIRAQVEVLVAKAAKAQARLEALIFSQACSQAHAEARVAEGQGLPYYSVYDSALAKAKLELTQPLNT